jgi:hypothetical protein
MTVNPDAWPGERVAKTRATTVRYETHVTIDRPLADVFEQLADLDGYRGWMHRTGLFRRSGQTSDGALDLGTRTGTPREWAHSTVE